MRRILYTTGVVLLSVGLATSVYGVVTLKQDNQDYRDANDKLNVIVETIQNENNILSKELADINELMGQLTEKVDTLSKENQELVSKNEVLSKSNEDLTKSNEELKDKYEELQKSYNTKTTGKVQTTSSSLASRGEQSTSRTITVQATAYTAYCKGCSGVTKTGINLRANPDIKLIATDPNVIPLGSKVYVEGYGYAIAGDTGGAIKGNKIDVFIPDYNDAVEFGRKTLKVTILK